MVAITSGERYEVKHKIVFAQGRPGRCVAILPSGDVCRRSCNFVEVNWLVPHHGKDDPRTPGHWRHNPRPYVNY